MSPFVRRASIRHTDRVLARSVMLLLFAVYFAATPGRLVSGRAEAEYTAARVTLASITGQELPLSEAQADGALVERQTSLGARVLAIPFLLVGDLASWAADGVEARHAATVTDGRKLLPQLMFGLAGAFFTALTGWTIVLAARRLGAARAPAFLAALAYGLGSHAWAGGRGGLAITLATFSLMSAFHLLLRVREDLDRLRIPPPSHLLWIGACLAIALVTEAMLLPAVVYVTCVSHAIFRRGWQRLDDSSWTPKDSNSTRLSVALAFMWIPVFAALGWIAWLGIDSEQPKLFGLIAIPIREFGDWTSRALSLLVSPGDGLFWFAPWAVFASWARAGKRGRRERLGTWTTVVLFVSCFVLAVGIETPHSYDSYGPRALLPVLPFFALGFALAINSSDARLRRGLGMLAVLLGVLVQVPGALIRPETHLDLAAQSIALAQAVELGTGTTDATNSGLSSAKSATSLSGANSSGGDSAGDEAWRSAELWSWCFAAPWAHWRIIRNRVAVGGETVLAAELYFVEHPARIRPAGVGPWGFRHMAWVDLDRRLSVSPWWGSLMAGFFLIVGVVFAVLGLDSTAA
ncbi:MAG: hypothetical protein ACI841_000763 [Planctomycetota bacterium]|jgi:hypothetical protein